MNSSDNAYKDVSCPFTDREIEVDVSLANKAILPNIIKYLARLVRKSLKFSLGQRARPRVLVLKRKALGKVIL
ncbi:MAG: hypothetical protein HC908_09835 [Calothrix sp. SM1_7_51]|nr:hypothetical protein [Calothrix sp. SM1_7_51]